MTEILNAFTTEIIIPMGTIAVGLFVLHGGLWLIAYHNDQWSCLNATLWSHWATQSANIACKFPAIILYTIKHIIEKTGSISVAQVWGVILVTTALVAVGIAVLYFLHKLIYNRELDMN